MGFTTSGSFLPILCVGMMLLLSMIMVTLWMKKVAEEITFGSIHLVTIS